LNASNTQVINKKYQKQFSLPVPGHRHNIVLNWLKGNSLIYLVNLSIINKITNTTLSDMRNSLYIDQTVYQTICHS